MKTVQKALTGALFAATLGVLSQPVWAVDCSTISTVGGFALAGSCTDDDKIYTYQSSTLAPTLGLSFSSGGDVHQIFVGGGAPIYGGASPNADFTLVYSIEIDLVMSPTATITSVDLDSTVGNVNGTTRTTTVTKEVEDIDGNLLGTLTSINGNPAPTLAVNETYLLITETFSKTGLAILNSSQNTFTQNETRVPEPGTLALLGLGLLGFAAVRRRRS